VRVDEIGKSQKKDVDSAVFRFGGRARLDGRGIKKRVVPCLLEGSRINSIGCVKIAGGCGSCRLIKSTRGGVERKWILGGLWEQFEEPVLCSLYGNRAERGGVESKSAIEAAMVVQGRKEGTKPKTFRVHKRGKNKKASALVVSVWGPYSGGAGSPELSYRLLLYTKKWMRGGLVQGYYDNLIQSQWSCSEKFFSVWETLYISSQGSETKVASVLKPLF